MQVIKGSLLHGREAVRRTRAHYTLVAVALLTLLHLRMSLLLSLAHTQRTYTACICSKLLGMLHTAHLARPLPTLEMRACWDLLLSLVECLLLLVYLVVLTKGFFLNDSAIDIKAVVHAHRPTTVKKNKRKKMINSFCNRIKFVVKYLHVAVLKILASKTEVDYLGIVFARGSLFYCVALNKTGQRSLLGLRALTLSASCLLRLTTFLFVRLLSETIRAGKDRLINRLRLVLGRAG